MCLLCWHIHIFFIVSIVSRLHSTHWRITSWLSPAADFFYRKKLCSVFNKLIKNAYRKGKGYEGKKRTLEQSRTQQYQINMCRYNYDPKNDEHELNPWLNWLCEWMSERALWSIVIYAHSAVVVLFFPLNSLTVRLSLEIWFYMYTLLLVVWEPNVPHFEWANEWVVCHSRRRVVLCMPYMYIDMLCILWTHVYIGIHSHIYLAVVIPARRKIFDLILIRWISLVENASNDYVLDDFRFSTIRSNQIEILISFGFKWQSSGDKMRECAYNKLQILRVFYEFLCKITSFFIYIWLHPSTQLPSTQLNLSI